MDKISLVGINFKENTKYEVDENFCGDIYFAFNDYGLFGYFFDGKKCHEDLIKNFDFILRYGSLEGLSLYCQKAKPVLLGNQDEIGFYVISNSLREWYDDVESIKKFPRVNFNSDNRNVMLRNGDIIIPKKSFVDQETFNLDKLLGIKVEIIHS